MHDILSLHPQGFTAEDADRHYALGHVRAVAHSPLGSGFGGLVVSRVKSLTTSTPTTSTSSTPPLTTCPDGALCGLIVPQPPSKVPSFLPPALVNLLATVTVAGGRQRGFSEHLTTLREAPEGVLDAAGLVLGIHHVHFLLEVVGDDVTAVAQRLSVLTDHQDVVDVRSFVVGREGTRGFGGPAAAKARTGRVGVRKAAKRS